MDDGRVFWIGELLEPVEDFPHETHCIHITTPVKSVVFGVMHGDAAVMAVAAQIIHKDGLKSDKPINPRWIDLQEAHYRAAAQSGVEKNEPNTAKDAIFTQKHIVENGKLIILYSCQKCSWQTESLDKMAEHECKRKNGKGVISE